MSFDGTFMHVSAPGVAWRVLGPEMETPECEGHPDDGMFDGPMGETFYCDGSCMGPCETGMLRAMMIGDDRVEIIDPDDLVPIGMDDFCGACGQIGCTHDGR